MQVGNPSSAAAQRQRRHFRYVTLVTALITVIGWLWAVFVAGMASGSITDRAQTGLALIVASVATLALIAFWRKPVRPSLYAAEPPDLQYSRASHHAGHLVAAYVENPQGITRVSLTGRCPLPSHSAAGQNHTSLRRGLRFILAGLTAEEIFTGESSTNVAADLASATRLGADMAGRFGMAGSLVSLATGRTRRTEFVDRVVADPRTRKELEAMLRDAKRDTMRLLLENRHLIVAVRDALLRKETLTIAEIHHVLDEAQQRHDRNDQVLVDLRSAGERPRQLFGIAGRQ